MLFCQQSSFGEEWKDHKDHQASEHHEGFWGMSRTDAVSPNWLHIEKFNKQNALVPTLRVAAEIKKPAQPHWLTCPFSERAQQLPASKWFCFSLYRDGSNTWPASKQLHPLCSMKAVRISHCPLTEHQLHRKATVDWYIPATATAYQLAAIQFSLFWH